MSLKQDILAAQDLPTRELQIDGWPAVWVRTLNVKELEQLTRLDAGDKFEAESLARICVLVLSKDNGDRIFEDDDVPMLMLKPFSVLQKIVDAALEHNKLTEPEGAEAGNAG